VPEAQAAQRDDSPMDVDQPSPLEQDPAPLGMTHFQLDNASLKPFNVFLLLYMIEQLTHTINALSALDEMFFM